jgi:hypothetical protein
MHLVYILIIKGYVMYIGTYFIFLNYLFLEFLFNYIIVINN